MLYLRPIILGFSICKRHCSDHCCTHLSWSNTMLVFPTLRRNAMLLPYAGRTVWTSSTACCHSTPAGTPPCHAVHAAALRINAVRRCRRRRLHHRAARTSGAAGSRLGSLASIAADNRRSQRAEVQAASQSQGHNCRGSTGLCGTPHVTDIRVVARTGR